MTTHDQENKDETLTFRSILSEVTGGAIVAYGCTDLDDPASNLHDRTRIGVMSDNGYHSVDPGKLTTAPLFAMRTANAALAPQ